MTTLKLLNNGTWNKSPVLTATRKILMDKLAEQWPLLELGEIATFTNGTSYEREQLVEGGTPIIRISNISDPKSTYLTTSERFDDRFKVEVGDLLVSWSASFKSIIWPGPAGILNQHIFKVIEKTDQDRTFIRHAIEAALEEMQEKVVGIGMMHLRRSDFLSHKVPVPDLGTQKTVATFLDWIEKRDGSPAPTLPMELDEQRRIVARIEELAAKIEEARGLRREAMREVEVVIDSARTVILGEALRNQVTELDKVATLERGKFSHRPRNEPRFFGGSHPWIQIGEIEASGKYIRNWKDTLNDEGLAISRKFPRGTLLISIAATIGAVGILDFDCCVPDSIVAITPHTFISSEFLYHHLCYLRGHLEHIAPQSAQKNINLKTLAPLPIPVMALDEQRRIVAYLDEVQAKVEAVKQLQAESAAELDALLPSLLDRAFKGELV